MHKKKLRICFITEDFYPEFIGGQGIYGWKLVSEMVKMRNKVTVLAENRKGRREFWPFAFAQGKGVQVLLTPFVFGNQLLLALLEYLLFKWKLGKDYFDIVHANQLSGLFFILFRPKNAGKIVVSVHNTNYDMAQKTNSRIKWFFYQPLIWLERIVYRKADGLLFNSANEEKELLNYYQIRGNPTKSVYPGVEMPKFTEEERKQAQIQIRKGLGLTEKVKIVLYIGRLVKRKRVDVLVKLMKRFKSAQLLIIGGGVEREALERVASANVRFLGFVEDTRPYLLATDLFVTVSEAEGGFLLSALEAASYGLPLILSPSAAGFPIIKEGVNGFVVEPSNTKKLSEKMNKLLKRSKIMGEASKNLAKAFSWRKCSTQTFNFYQFLLKDNFPKQGSLTRNL